MELGYAGRRLAKKGLHPLPEHRQHLRLEPGVLLEPGLIPRAGMREWKHLRPVFSPRGDRLSHGAHLRAEVVCLGVLSQYDREAHCGQLPKDLISQAGAHSGRGGLSPEDPVPGKQKPIGTIAISRGS